MLVLCAYNFVTVLKDKGQSVGCCENIGVSAKVAIVGAGNVGSAAAYAMMMDGVVCEIALIDKNKDRAEGEALDLRHGVQFSSVSKIVFGDSYELVRDAQVVVVTAGVAQKPGESREGLVQTNTQIFSQIIPEIAKHNKSCVLLVVTNPLDVMTYVAWKLSGFPKERVIGTGTVLDTARLRYLIAKEIHVSPKDICAHVLGEHGDSSFPWWSRASIAGVSLDSYAKLSAEFKEQLKEEVRTAAYQVIKKKGATFYAIGLVIAKLVRAMLLNQPRIYSVSTILDDYLGINGVALSVPAVVRASGVTATLQVALDVKEAELFKTSANAVKQGIAAAQAVLDK